MRAAAVTFSITPHGSYFVALATFAPGLGSARRPIAGPPAATREAALVALLAMPRLGLTVLNMVDPPIAPDAD